MKKGKAKKKVEMFAAFVKTDITPPIGRVTETGGVSIAMDEQPHGKLQLRLVLFRYRGVYACIACTDLKSLKNDTADFIRQSASEASGIPLDNILLSASHTHTVPDLNRKGSEEVAGKFIEAIAEARNNLAPADHWIAGSAMSEAWAICRRPICRTPSGRLQIGSQGRQTDSFAGLDGEDETTISAIAMFGKENSLLGGVVNYACHPTTMYRQKFYCPDFPGPLCEGLDERYPAVFIYANGPSGNVNPANSGEEFCRRMGGSLAAKVPVALSNGKESGTDTLRIFNRNLQLERRKPTPEQVHFAHEFIDSEPTQEEAANFTRKMYGIDYHFQYVRSSKNACRQLIALDKEIRNGKSSERVTVQVIAVGDVAFIGFSAEMFNQFGRRLRARSPFKHNVVIQQANGSNGYIAPAENMAFGGYECCLGMISRMVPETGDIMVDTAIELLEKAKE